MNVIISKSESIFKEYESIFLNNHNIEHGVLGDR